VHAFAYTNLIGDALHNFLDGVIIAGSYLVSVPVGMATTLAVMLHEIPQEIGDFSVLIHGGFTRQKALWLNFLTALSAVVGAALTLVLAERIEGLVSWLLPLAAGGFIYIASADLIPELHKDATTKRSLGQILAFIIGIGVMASLLLLE
jgi:zinc and cadmium transporter